MMQLARMRALATEDAATLPWWVVESIDDAADRIEELEGLWTATMDENAEMFAALQFYATQPNGERARVITER